MSVVAADGWTVRVGGRPFDRIEATVGVWDLSTAWLEQLEAAGVIVAPLIELFFSILQRRLLARRGSPGASAFHQRLPVPVGALVDGPRFPSQGTNVTCAK